MAKIVRLRDLATDLRARIRRGKEEEARLQARVERLLTAGEELRACKGELAMLEAMLEQAEKNQPKMEGTEETPPPV